MKNVPRNHFLNAYATQQEDGGPRTRLLIPQPGTPPSPLPEDWGELRLTNPQGNSVAPTKKGTP